MQNATDDGLSGSPGNNNSHAEHQPLPSPPKHDDVLQDVSALAQPGHHVLHHAYDPTTTTTADHAAVFEGHDDFLTTHHEQLDSPTTYKRAHHELGETRTSQQQQHDHVSEESPAKRYRTSDATEQRASDVLGLSEAMHNGDDTRISNTGTMNPTSNAASSTAAANKKVNNEQWDAMFERLGRYKEQHGDCLVPKRYAEDPKLGTWVETQRVQYKRLDRAVDEISGIETVAPNKRLNMERLAKLQSIGFAWSAKTSRKSMGPSPVVGANPRKKSTSSTGVGPSAAPNPRVRSSDTQWDSMYQRLIKFREMHGHCLVPRKYEEDPRLASWVETQRALWNRDFRLSATKHSAGEGPMEPAPQPEGDNGATIPSEPVRMASESTIPFVDPAMVADLDELNETVGGGATAEDAAELAAAMGDGGADIMMDEKDGLEPVSAGEMISVDAVVDTASEGAYESEGKNRVGPPLPSNRMSQERKDKLDAIGFVWSLRSKRVEDHWDQMFRQLVEYKEQHGDCLVPSRYEPNQKLGKWVETQRYEYTKLQRAANGAAVGAPESGAPGSKARAASPRLTEERLRRLNSIGFEWKVKHKMKRYYDRQWDQMFDRLLKFKQENGSCSVPKRYPPDQKLGTWVHTQRIQYRKLVTGRSSDTEDAYVAEDPTRSEEEQPYRLTAERRRRLEEIGFCWSAREGDKAGEQGKIVRNSYDDQWDYMFNRLKDFKEKNGHCLVPKRFKEDQKLGTWVDTQRVQFKKLKKKLASQGRDNEGATMPTDDSESDAPVAGPEKPVVGRLTDDRIRRLTDLGFVWSLRDDWQQHYDELKAFKERYGHCNVPARFAENRKLGIFVSAQRQQYKMMQTEGKVDADQKNRRPAPLTQERIDLLNKIGFTWSLRSRDALAEYWNQRFCELQKFHDEHGHCNVPSRYPENPELGTWVGTQRTQYRLYLKAKATGDPTLGATTMTEERVQQLESLGFQWTRGGKKKSDNDSVENIPVKLEDHDNFDVPSAIRDSLDDDETDEILRQAIGHEEI